MPLPAPLTENQVYQGCPEDKLDFTTTEDLQDLDQPYGQDRVLRALEFGAGIQAEGFNLFVLGPSGAGKHELVERFLSLHAARQQVPPDWCHVYNFRFSDRPSAIQLPAGQGQQFKKDMNGLAEKLRTAITAAFESEEYQARLQELQEEMANHQHLAGQIEHRARQGNLYTDFTLIRGGSMHRASGGYLIIDARRVLTQPMAWESAEAHSVLR